MLNLLAAFALLSAPVFLGTYAWGLFLISQKVPIWAFVLIGICHVTVALGFAALLDKRQ